MRVSEDTLPFILDKTKDKTFTFANMNYKDYENTFSSQLGQ